jgi:tetratricopeptide (TPR) repeat protein
MYRKRKKITIYELKVVQSNYSLRIRGRPYRTIAVSSNISLYELAKIITDSFDFFDFDHLFGFYNNPRDPRHSGEGYELLADMGQGIFFPGVKGTKLDQVFKGSEKWLFLFDLGDLWNFLLWKVKERDPAPGESFPSIINTACEPFPQYPDFEEEYGEDIPIGDSEPPVTHTPHIDEVEGQKGTLEVEQSLSTDGEREDSPAEIEHQRTNAILDAEDPATARTSIDDPRSDADLAPSKQDENALLERGVALLLEDRFEESAEVFDVGMGRFPGNWKFPVHKALVLNILGGWEEALTLLSDVPEDSEDYGYSLMLRSVALRSLDRYDESLDAIDMAIEEYDDREEVIISKTETLMCVDRFEEAFDLLKELGASGSKNEMVPHLLDIAREELDRQYKAFQLVFNLLETDPDVLQDHLDLVMECGGPMIDDSTLGRLVGKETCLRETQRTLDHIPEIREATMTLGGMLNEIDPDAKTITRLYDMSNTDIPRKVLEIVTGMWLMSGGELKGGDMPVKEFERERDRLIGKATDFIANKEDRRKGKGRPKRKDGMRYDLDGCAAVIANADLLHSMGEDEKVLEFLDGVLMMDPENHGAHLSRAETCYHLGMKDETLGEVEWLIDRFPEDNRYMLLRMNILFRLDRSDEALEVAERILERKGDRTASARLIDSAWELVNDLRDCDALDLIETVARARPRNEKAMEMRERILSFM